MKVLDLFSGIGGFSIGLEKAGFETVAFCEIEDYPRAVLRKHWPDTPIYRDIKKLTAEQLRADGLIPDVICGGYPCQPFSVAGKQLAERDERHLFPEVLRLVRSIRPRWCIFENVSGHIKLGYDTVASSLENEGYSVWTHIIPACAVGAPHRRDRLWIVANAQHNGRATTTKRRSPEETTSEQPQGQDNTFDAARASGLPATRQDVADTDGIGRPRQGQSFQSIGAEKATDWEASQSEPVRIGDFWQVESDVGRVVDGLPNRSHRIKCLGNAIVPQIAEIIGQTIMRYEAQNG